MVAGQDPWHQRPLPGFIRGGGGVAGIDNICSGIGAATRVLGQPHSCIGTATLAAYSYDLNFVFGQSHVSQGAHVEGERSSTQIIIPKIECVLRGDTNCPGYG